MRMQALNAIVLAFDGYVVFFRVENVFPWMLMFMQKGKRVVDN